VPVTGRTQAELEQLVGCFVNVLSRNPLVQVVIQLLNMPALARPHAPEASRDHVPAGGWQPRDHSSSRFDLSLRLKEVGPELAGELIYADELFEPATVAQLASSLGAVLDQIAADPSRRLSPLQLAVAAQ
jgi:non-ribosomal peptide synthetase component F